MVPQSWEWRRSFGAARWAAATLMCSVLLLSATAEAKKKHHQTSSQSEDTPAATTPAATSANAATAPDKALADVVADQETKAAPPAPAAVPVESVKPGTPAPAAPPPSFRLNVAVAGGSSTQSETQDAAALIRGSISADWEFHQDFFARASFSASFYDAKYLTVGPTPEGAPLNQAQVAEQRYDAGLGLGYRAALLNDHLELEPALMVRFYSFRNIDAPVNMLGLSPELLVRLRPVASFAIEANGGYAYNLASVPTSNALGKPLSMGAYGLGARYYFSEDRQSVKLGYVGEVLTLEHSYRLYNTIEAAYSVAF